MKKKEKFKRPEIIVPLDFRQWWEPWGNDKATGASLGGHPDSLRMWSRPEPDGSYARRMFGINTVKAWCCESYRNEYMEWKSFGSPAREDFVSMAAPLERQREFWHDISPFVAMIGKPLREKAKIAEEYKTDELKIRVFEKYNVPA